jgi:hypothetical protein
MGNISCQNYYCQDVSFKPEWLSENSWNIEYINPNKDIELDSNKKYSNYSIDKGILKIDDCPAFKLLLSKKLLIDFSVTECITIPFNFSYNILSNTLNTSKINIYLIFSIDNLSINYISNFLENKISKKLSNKLFYIDIELEKSKIMISHSFSENIIIKKKIISNNTHNITLDLENKINILYIKEHMLSHDINEQYFIDNIFNNDNNNDNNSIYLNLFIHSDTDLNKSEYLKINFD